MKWYFSVAYHQPLKAFIDPALRLNLSSLTAITNQPGLTEVDLEAVRVEIRRAKRLPDDAEVIILSAIPLAGEQP